MLSQVMALSASLALIQNKATFLYPNLSFYAPFPLQPQWPNWCSSYLSGISYTYIMFAYIISSSWNILSDNSMIPSLPLGSCSCVVPEAFLDHPLKIASSPLLLSLRIFVWCVFASNNVRRIGIIFFNLLNQLLCDIYHHLSLSLLDCKLRGYRMPSIQQVFNTYLVNDQMNDKRSILEFLVKCFVFH